ncbi:gamma-butyrobetaine dioxygenase [Clupea harengus]|uniref:gamma-butyrobetaine dioxygenase n=1 Tax=Clupea harengus TaxID=7950 RepID=A0A6P8F9R1_CLUHA|nr:gamma-butyrobetaine dioxygenase [Clupea harengus]XP_031425264.1 gamma-butyrobetaine dioxygenase [Clupea harengus]XP_042564011.1 gamma-butyrobetaine dioxygenase [Clupea harengus]XP_042564012.1 gamma-butyrobetaine dioxygenase [Clupea harengus]
MLSRLARCVSSACISRATRQVVNGHGKRKLPAVPVVAYARGHQTLATATSSLPVVGATPVVRHARTLEQERLLQVEWEDGSCSLYPFTWLRDNCQCPLCTLQSAQARSLPLSQLDVHTGVDSVQVTENNKVSVIWPDQHSSEFNPNWLKKRCFSPEARQATQEELFLNEREYWDTGLRIPTASFEEVLHDDKAALDWLLALRRVGIVYLKGAPVEQGQVARLSERIGYLRLTFYGHTWQVQDKPMANNVAYTSGKLSLHTDYPALHYPPGVQFLHCLAQAREGGESEVVDGFHMAELLRRRDPEAFRALTTLRVDFTDTGTDYCDFCVQSKNHIIDVDHVGRVVRINYNNATRDSVLDFPLDKVQHFYASLKAYVGLMTQPENVVTYTMKPGDLVTFDNWRLLHGRRNYLSDANSRRHLEGAYLDWDEVMSRLRILRKAVHGDN